MGRGTIVSPYIYEAVDYTRVNVIRITVDFDDTSHVITGASVYRDAACLFKKIYIGLGPDGTPDTTPKVFSVPAGTTAITAAQLSHFGLNSIEDVLALQIVAGP